MRRGRSHNTHARYLASRRGPKVAKASRDDEREAEEFERRAARLAPTVGFCGYCGKLVDEPNGKLHGHDCSVPEERRRLKGETG